MGGGQKVGATWETQALSVTPNGCNQPTPAVTRRRGVEDAAPYGRVLDVSVRIVVNRCVNAANLRPPLGSPERGAVAALCAVTEGLVQRGCGAITLPVNWRREGVEARPYGVWGGGCAEPASTVDRRRRTGDGAPYDVWESISVKPASSVIQRKGRRGRRPLRVVR